MFYVDVVIKSNTRMTGMTYTYSVGKNLESDIEIGKRVVVGFGKSNKATLALIVAIKKDFNLDFTTKDIIAVVDSYPIVDSKMLDLANFMVAEYLSDFSSAVATVLPPGNLDNLTEYYSLTSLSSRENLGIELFDFLSESRSFKEVSDKFDNRFKRIDLNRFIEKGLLNLDYELKSNARPKFKLSYRINPEFDINLLNRAKTQKKAFEIIKNKIELDRDVLLNEYAISSQIIKELVEKNAILIKRERVYRNVLKAYKSYSKVELNREQKRVYEGIVKSDKTVNLIHGVTASGKTEIYLQLVERVLDQGKQAIILVPEISLTPQTIERFHGRFKKNIAVLHSKLSTSERFDQWKLIKMGEVDIAIGARSALFAPFDKLGIIVIDEEHELSYFSERNPKYSSISLAEYRARQFGAKLVLGSATPSIPTYKRAMDGDIGLFEINKRVDFMTMPSVKVIDMRRELKNLNYSIFSNELKDSIEKALMRREQTILFLNKRGHTSYVFCRNCGYVYKCDACDVSMTYHLNSDRLICHYCGRTKKKPLRCEACGSTKIKEFGAGTEMLEEETRKLFPNARIARMDRDTTNNKFAYDKIYNKMKNGEYDILIGTQMIAKGFDFENVSLVGVILADMSLNISDYKANERTFQLMTQVSGRAGRGKNVGKVVIQTYKPDNFAIKTSTTSDYSSFYSSEIKIRRDYFYPPFSHILLVKLSDLDRKNLVKRAKLVGDYIYKKGIFREIKGPMPSVIEKINKRYRFNIIIKDENLEKLKDMGKKILAKFKNRGDFRLDVHLNPISIY